MSRPPIVAICPGGVVTGGPEAQHQLVDMANEISPGSGFVCYTPFGERHEVPEPYRTYDTPVIGRHEIPDDAFIVIPEIWPDLIHDFSQPCAFWWLSVDNFWDWSGDTDTVRKAAVQLVQSEYARRHLAQTLGMNALMLTDYINTSYDSTGVFKLRRVAVNPTKGAELIEEFRGRFPDIEVVELAGMSREQVRAELASSAVYIDFGHHPGRDRLPREAAVCETVVMTTRLGAAANPIDVPIRDWYKFDTVDELGPKVRSVFASFGEHLMAQRPYLEVIRAQRQRYRHEVERLLSVAEVTAILTGRYRE